MQGGSWSGEVEDIAKDGRRLTVMLRADAIKDESGKIIGLLAINTDITEHKKTEAALQASEARFKSIVATSQEWIWAIDTQGVHTYSNSTIEKILGFTPDEIVRHGAARSLVAEEDIPKMTEMLVRAIEQKKGWSNLVLRWKHKDGTYRYLESNAVPIFDNAGVLKGFQGSDRDITQRIYAEQSLRESANQYRLLTEKMSDIIWTTDIHLRTTYVSPSVRNVLGFTQEERLSQALEEQLTPDSLSSAWATLNNELAVEKTGNADPQRNITVTLEYYHKDGSTRWLETNISWLRNDQGVATGLHGVARDITNRKLVENALEES
jgi:PAS domain S-box-containing protein